MSIKELQSFETDYLLEAIYLRYGYDFRHYARASLKRRINKRLQDAGLEHISELVPRILYDEAFFEAFLDNMSIPVTEMFRNPGVFRQIRERVLPKLKTYSRINIWHVGCATGEEVYSMAILLEEEGLLSRSRLYATDFNNCSLEEASKGIYRAELMQTYTENYIKAGGKGSFSDYYRARYGSARIKESLREHITFAHHNLMRDGEFAEMHLILCRNVLIYFDKTLQEQVLALLGNSLVRRGFLVLGDKESLEFTAAQEAFECIDRENRIYRRAAHV